MYPTDLTVAAVVEHDNKYLLVEEQFLRLVYAATFIGCDESLPLDDGILSRRWMTQQDLIDRRTVLRSPAVLRCVQDYEAGKRQSDALLAGMVPLQQNVHRILASADLV
jgi:hypothetical protein